MMEYSTRRYFRDLITRAILFAAGTTFCLSVLAIILSAAEWLKTGVFHLYTNREFMFTFFAVQWPIANSDYLGANQLYELAAKCPVFLSGLIASALIFLMAAFTE